MSSLNGGSSASEAPWFWTLDGRGASIHPTVHHPIIHYLLLILLYISLLILNCISIIPSSIIPIAIHIFNIIYIYNPQPRTNLTMINMITIEMVTIRLLLVWSHMIPYDPIWSPSHPSRISPSSQHALVTIANELCIASQSHYSVTINVTMKNTMKKLLHHPIPSSKTLLAY